MTTSTDSTGSVGVLAMLDAIDADPNAFSRDAIRGACMWARNEIMRLYRVEKNAMDLRDVVESIGVSGAARPPKAETLQAQCRLVVRAFDEGCKA